MTPEERTMLDELIAWKKSKENQQISLPVDDASLAAIGSISVVSEGVLANQTLNLTGNAQNIDVTVATAILTIKYKGNTYNLLCQ